MAAQEFQNALDQLQGCLSNVTLLSTSRLRALYLDIPPPQFLELQPLTQEEAQRLLCRVCPQLKDEPFMAEQLAKQCGSIPIALKVVANTIEQLEVTAEVCLLYNGHHWGRWLLVYCILVSGLCFMPECKES